MAITQDQKTALLGVTSFMFDYAPDQASFDRFESTIEANPSFYALGSGLAQTEAFTSQFADGATDSDKAGVILNRLGLEDGSEGYKTGMDFISARLDDGADFGQVVIEIGEKMLADEQLEELESASATLKNKIDVANAYLESGVEGYSSETLPVLLDGIDETQQSVNDAKASIEEIAPDEPGVSGDTFSLTDAISKADTDEGLPADYELSGTSADLGALAIAGIDDAVANAQSIVDGAANAADLGDLDASYTIEDSLENVAAADDSVLDGVDYALTNEAGELTGLSDEEVALVEGATNSDDYTFPTGEDLELTGDTDNIVASDYQLADGETEADVVRSTDGDDTINAVASGLTSERTLNPADQIDGGEGNDTLVVEQSGDFTGFTGDGGMTNVENIEITSTSNLSRSFDASDVEGVESISIDANDQNYTVSDLAAAGLNVAATGMDDDTLTVGFTSAAVEGDADALSLEATDLGDEDNSVTVAAAGIEELSIASDGTANALDLDGGADLETLNVSGDADLGVTNVATSLTDVDGAAAAGDLALDLSNADELESVSTGAGDDNVTVGGGFAVNATFNGGEGDDTLALAGDVGTKQPTISGFETLNLTDAQGTIAGSNVTGLEALGVRDGLTDDLLVSNVAAPSMNIELAQTEGGSYSSGNTLTYSEASDLTVSTANLDADATSNASIGTNVAASKATSLVVDVAANTDLSGNVTVNTATSATVNVAEDAALASGATVSADAATNATLDFDSEVTGALNFAKATDVSLTSSAAQSALNLQANAAQSLTIDSIAATTLAGSASLASLGTLTLNGIGRFDGTGVALGAESSSVTIDATNVQEDNAGSGSVIATIGGFADGGGQAVVNGSELRANELTIGDGRNEVIVTGGEENDTVEYNTVIGEGDEAAINIDLGDISGGDSLKLADGANDFSNANVTLSGVDAIEAGSSGNDLTLNADVVSGQDITLGDNTAFGDVTLNGTDGADTIDFSGITAQLSATTNVLEINGGEGNDTITVADSVMSGTESAAVQEVVGGAGQDTIVLNTATDAGEEAVVVYEATNATEMAAEGGDTLQNFSDGSDVIQFASGLLTASGDAALNATGASVQETSADANFASAVSDSSSAGVIEISSEFTGDMNATDVAAFLEDGTVASDMAVVFAVDDGTDTYMWHFDGSVDSDATAATEVADNELTLVGTIQGEADLATDASSFDIA
ncbi:beta strand repeat-containing protein [Vreelandella jeotgali]|uniref:beta strand repeat-containing protein n=1 Tax=Vreelandella jeotgali TaxID=553386 RepID=UPI000349FBB9|nr:hypothetical protein [Halomonas jeotgali]